MISSETRVQIRKRMAKQHTRMVQQAQLAQAQAQVTINAVMYQIIMQNALAQRAEDDDSIPENPTLTIPAEEFQEVPKGFGLSVTQDAETGNVKIMATVAKPKPKSNIILPPDEIIT